MKLTSWLQFVDELQQAGKIDNLQQVGKIDNLQQVCSVFGCVGLLFTVRAVILVEQVRNILMLLPDHSARNFQ